MDANTARRHTISSLSRLREAGDVEALAQWCEWNDPNGDYLDDGSELWSPDEYWTVIVAAFDR